MRKTKRDENEKTPSELWSSTISRFDASLRWAKANPSPLGEHYSYPHWPARFTIGSNSTKEGTSMRTRAGRIAGTIGALCFVALMIAFTSTSALAQVNAWINATSGNWDQSANWSLGVLPNSSHSVM